MTKLELVVCNSLVELEAPGVIEQFNKDNQTNVVRDITKKEVDRLAFEAAVDVLDFGGLFSEKFAEWLQEVWDDSDDSDSPWNVAALEQRQIDGDAELNDCNRFNYGP